MSGNSYELYVSFYIIGNGNYTGSLNLSASTISTRSALLSAASTSKGIKLTWETEGGLGYYIYRKAGNGKYSMVKKITKASTGSWVDTDSAKIPVLYLCYQSIHKKWKQNSLRPAFQHKNRRFCTIDPFRFPKRKNRPPHL